MAQRYENNEPQVGDSREQCEQVTFGFMNGKVEREKERCSSESERRVLDTFHNELNTARQDSVHERSVVSTHIISLPSDDMPPEPENPPAERVGVVLGQLGDVLEQHSTALSLPSDQISTPVTHPFVFSAPSGPFVEFKERVERAVNRIVPSQPTALDDTHDPPVPPLPPLDSSTFNSIARELIQLTDGMSMLPRQLALCLYFCYRLGVRLLSQYLANRLGLGNTLRDLMETCVQFLVEQQLLPIVQQHGGWASYIEQWVQPNTYEPGEIMTTNKVIGYIGLGLAVGFALGFLVCSIKP